MILAGIQTIRTVPNSIPLAPNISWEIRAAVAAETGLPVIPNEADTVARLTGRSGRILFA